jgi:hypothetical protein
MLQGCNDVPGCPWMSLDVPGCTLVAATCVLVLDLDHVEVPRIYGVVAEVRISSKSDGCRVPVHRLTHQSEKIT